MTSGTTTVNLATSIAHLPFGPISTLNLPNGANSRPTFDQDYRNTRLNYSGVLDRTLSYDTRDLITGISDAINPARSQTYGYDALARLTSASSAASYGTQGWTYDANANRITETRNGATDSYTLIPGSQRLQAISGTRNVNYAYDPGGHLIDDGTKSYTHDVAGRLSAIQSGASTLMQAQYTPEGTRQSKTASGVTHRYVYDQTGHLLADLSPTGTINAEYVWLEDQPLALITTRTGSTTKETFYFHNDHLGTPQRITDASKAIVWEASYEPFGKATLTTNLVENPIRLPGQVFDPETGLHQNWHRDYDPSLGRYIQSDAIGLEAGLNTYVYALNSPLVYDDPDGLDAYRCRRRLGNPPGGRIYGRAQQHFYSCVVSRDGTSTCGGQTASDSFFGSPGRPTTPKEDYFHPDACGLSEKDNQCFDDCLREEFAKPRPYYSVVPGVGTQCQQFDADINQRCRTKCGKAK